MGFVDHGFTATWDKILGLPHHHTYIQSTHELFCVCVCVFVCLRERERESMRWIYVTIGNKCKGHFKKHNGKMMRTNGTLFIIKGNITRNTHSWVWSWNNTISSIPFSSKLNKLLANYQFFTLSPIDQENILGFGQTCTKLKLLDVFKKFPFFFFFF